MVEEMKVDLLDVDWENWGTGYEWDLAVIFLVADISWEKSKKAG